MILKNYPIFAAHRPYSMKYYIGKVLHWPLLPILHWQANRIWEQMPKLPEADLDRTGQVGPGQPALRLLALGESTVAGVGVESHKQGLTGHLATFLATHLNAAITWRVVAQTGLTARAANEVLIPQLTPDPVDLIVVGLGANDAFQRNAPRRWARDITTFLQNLRNIHPEPPIVFLNMAPVWDFPAFTRLIKFFIGNLIELLGAELSGVVEHFPGVWFYEERITYQHWINPNGQHPDKTPFFSDGVHPSAPTYGIWGQKLGAFVIEHIPLPKQT